MAQEKWINAFIIVVVFALSGCASHIDKVVPTNTPTMKQIYDSKTGNGNPEVLRRREMEIRARPISSEEDYISDLPPRAAQIQHLFPALPNPELYMYVRPHVIGNSGAAVPAYMTRFTMYDRTHYAMPNEVISRPKHPEVKCFPDHPKDGVCKRIEEVDERAIENSASKSKGKRT
ncbi:hypothetical protein GCM10011613_24970 [Cellvibrio zantedeschiae]|uniref:Uncharacterized protein n=1 Tax=Cellvibrio zantedeschiae TaxID=1237077 RepID=A0ABQ3B6C6_9GAMM|nr:TIGR03751 family conjugal transfer lipoprotein [Cellvibrio zantedeschiae]GGY79171.1 hypothetical protein GCM10011613_24970 [Cellvibrio zantedeschiae]